VTALGGVVGATAELPRLCTAILAAQRRYGDRVADIATVPGAVFGATCDGASASEHGRWLLVADCRLDNRAELIDALRLSARSQTDAQILIEAWLRWGESSLQRLLGDFAIAVYEGERRTLTLARDPTGQRPLFYKRAAGATAFASMPSGLARMFAASGPNLGLLARSLSNLLHDDRQSYFDGISRVLPGEVVEVSEDSIRSRLYWQPEVEHRSRGRSEDYVRSYRDLLDSAVECRLQGRPLPIGCHLSSGFDSSAVTATAARLVDRPGDLVAFTSAPLEGADQNLIRHRFADESPIAAQTARMHGLHHVIVRETAPLFEVIGAGLACHGKLVGGEKRAAVFIGRRLGMLGHVLRGAIAIVRI
jgi:asparagine synthase (glutamine-hydrolysing)